jgi:dUTP pyrophosphatase
MQYNKEHFYLMQTEDAKDLPLPKYMSELAAGLDLYANIHKPEIICVNKIKLIPTGIKVALPRNFEAQIRSRSGLAINHGVCVLNSPGTIDADYRGEIKVILINHGDIDFKINRGDRIAQMVLNEIVHAKFKLVQHLNKTKRNLNGFGHTGI